MVLKHRDTDVLRFDWLEPEGVHVVSVNEAALRFLPLEMHGEPTDEQLWRWLAFPGGVTTAMKAAANKGPWRL